MVACRNIKKGALLNLEDVRFAWPPLGITSDNWGNVSGAVLLQNIDEGNPITWQDIGQNAGIITND